MEPAIPVAVAVFAMAIAAGIWHSHPGHVRGCRRHPRTHLVPFLFVPASTRRSGVPTAFRHLRWPSWLTWIGLISYSLYLLHPLLVQVYYSVPWLDRHHPFGLQVLLAATCLGVIIGICSVTYLVVERPMQDPRRRVARWADAVRPDRAYPGAGLRNRPRAPRPPRHCSLGRSSMLV